MYLTVCWKSNFCKADQKCPDARRPKSWGVRRTMDVRCNDEGRGERRRWAFFSSLLSVRYSVWRDMEPDREPCRWTLLYQNRPAIYLQNRREQIMPEFKHLQDLKKRFWKGIPYAPHKRSGWNWWNGQRPFICLGNTSWPENFWREKDRLTYYN